jgi:hypothetical protein
VPGRPLLARFRYGFIDGGLETGFGHFLGPKVLMADGRLSAPRSFLK